MQGVLFDRKVSVRMKMEMLSIIISLASSFNPVLYLSSLKTFYFFQIILILKGCNSCSSLISSTIVSTNCNSLKTQLAGYWKINIKIKELIDQHDCRLVI